MSQYTQKEVTAEMARRKVQFHKDENWDTINLWGLFKYGNVSHLLKKGVLITNMKKENETIWVRPSKEFWEKEIKPLIETKTLEELTTLAGW